MTNVTVTAWVKVHGGPDLATSIDMSPETVAQAALTLDAVGGDGAEKDVELLSAAGSVVLLALSARTADGRAATIEVTPHNGAEAGGALEVTGALVVANAGALAALVAQGPRSLGLANAGAQPVEVSIITARAD